MCYILKYKGYLFILRNDIIDIYDTTPHIAVLQLIHTVNFIKHIHELLKCKSSDAGSRFEKNLTTNRRRNSIHYSLSI